VFNRPVPLGLGRLPQRRQLGRPTLAVAQHVTRQQSTMGAGTNRVGVQAPSRSQIPGPGKYIITADTLPPGEMTVAC
jgi:hypothetical protein